MINVLDYNTLTCSKHDLSHDVASGGDLTLCNKIYKPLVVYRFTENVMTSIITFVKDGHILTISRQNAVFD